MQDPLCTMNRITKCVKMLICSKSLICWETLCSVFLLFPRSRQTVEVEKRTHFAVVNLKTATTAAVSRDLYFVISPKNCLCIFKLQGVKCDLVNVFYAGLSSTYGVSIH